MPGGTYSQPCYHLPPGTYRAAPVSDMTLIAPVSVGITGRGFVVLIRRAERLQDGRRGVGWGSSLLICKVFPVRWGRRRCGSQGISAKTEGTTRPQPKEGLPEAEAKDATRGGANNCWDRPSRLIVGACSLSARALVGAEGAFWRAASSGPRGTHGQYLDPLPSGNPSGEIMRVLYPHARYAQDVVV